MNAASIITALLAATILAAPVSTTVAAADAADRVSAWSSGDARVIDQAHMRQAITHADYLIIGEIHDNPQHHRLQADLLGHFADSQDAAISVGYEQLSVDQQPLLDAFHEQATATADSFGEAVAWSQSGWPDYNIYQPLFAATLERGLPIIPLMFSRATTRDIVSNGIEVALAEDAMAQLRPDTLLSADARAAVEAEMQDAHCGKLPDAMLPAMVDVQIARDAFMAYRIVQAAERAVIITGNGHARRDRGIPQFIQRLRPDAAIVVVHLLEVAEGDRVAEQAVERAGTDITDYALFTPEHPRSDPCLAFQ